jgi:hypothetical protein
VFFVTCVCFCLLNVSLFSQSNRICEVKNTAFNAGEKVTYVLSYTWLFVWTDVGEATFSVKKDKKFGAESLHLHVLGKSYPFFDWFFKVTDIYESWVHPVNLRPIYFNRDISEGGYKKENEYFYNWEQNIVNARIRRRSGVNRFFDIPVDSCTIDVVSAIYQTRNFDFFQVFPGKSYPVSVLLDREVYSVTYTFIQREEKAVKGLGKFKTLKFKVELVAGDVFKEGQYLYVWVTDDKNKLPVYIESPIKVGSVRARIKNWEGLKHPLSSKID